MIAVASAYVRFVDAVNRRIGRVVMYGVSGVRPLPRSRGPEIARGNRMRRIVAFDEPKMRAGPENAPRRESPARSVSNPVIRKETRP